MTITPARLKGRCHEKWTMQSCNGHISVVLTYDFGTAKAILILCRKNTLTLYLVQLSICFENGY